MSSLPFLYISSSELGDRGVFTGAEIPAGTTIELAPVILLSAEDRKTIHETHLHDYYFQWDGNRAAIALGYGSLYNHSDAANAEFELDYDFKQIRFFALQDIPSGTEITTNYRTGAPDMTLWFEEK
ncbi:SET domain-containing protein [Neolewinella aurantiaca]|uniref:SET domain-containing protein n=1 Tax=Neolewinella aurantiaca TaxID=2602767 RepID=A0A5C7FLR3_9BACT|nr:SET domain-containing protein-lysine N-methyltransferase [Neolewinella aurantiaca]TXF88302.1 SET domain-containing protein [Neolewinella aurantiaca]